MDVASRSDDPLARLVYVEADHPYRTPFVRDIGRILHARAFRRLAGKTQVFTRRGQESDHARSRLTHTLEVAQIARTVAECLGLNAQLSEALALVHDIGHPPFGHAGEEALDRALERHGMSFDHNLHALRIVTHFEERYPGFPGLNLTLGVREGIVKHSRDYTAQEHPELVPYFLELQPPLEAQLIDLADEIAYLSADMEDGLSAGLVSVAGLRDGVPLFAGFYEAIEREYPAARSQTTVRLKTNEAVKQMLNALVTDLITEIGAQVRLRRIVTLDEVRKEPNRLVQLSQPMEAERRRAKAFLFEHLYLSPTLEAEHAHAQEVIQTLFTAWTADPDLLPLDHRARVETEGAPRAVADYLAGMTDAYIEQAFEAHRANKAG